MQGKMAIVGDGESITVFKAAGVAAFPAENSDAAKELVRKLAKEYAIIFITEEFSRPLESFLKRFDEEPYPVVLSVPSQRELRVTATSLLKRRWSGRWA